MPGDKSDDERFEEIVRLIKAGDPGVTNAVRGELERMVVPKRSAGPMPSGWYTIRVELLSGRDLVFDQPPGRDFLVSPHHTFRRFAEAINAAFGRWDLGHLYVFRMADGSGIGTPGDDLPYRDAATSKVGRREEAEVFEFEFDFGDGWEHRCTVLEVEVDPEDVYGVRPKGPVAVWGWGSIPDQYGRTTPEA